MDIKVINELFNYMYMNNIFCKYTYEKADEIAYIVLGCYLKNGDYEKLCEILRVIYKDVSLNEFVEVVHIRLVDLFTREVIRKALIGGCYES